MDGHQRQAVLIVDDDLVVRQALRDLLISVGYETLEAGDGVEAMDALLLRPDGLVVLLDLMMPHMSGREVLSLAQYDDALVVRHAFIIITANGDLLERRIAINPDLAMFLLRHAIPVIDKPFDVENILHIVAEAAHRLHVAVPARAEADRA
jgi:two-component system, response regulator, stage 0 sporulation protein F